MAGNTFKPGNTTFYIGAASAVPSSCTNISTYVTSFGRNGGDSKHDPIYLFGNAQIDKVSPRDQFEATFDVIVQNDSPMCFDAFMLGAAITSSTMESSATSIPLVIYAQQLEGTVYRSIGMNNCYAKFEESASAEEYVKGTLTVTCSAMTSSATSNVKLAKAAATAITFP